MDIKDLHDEYQRLLEDFCSCCKQNNLKYYAVGGTLLGAVRHKGFIPWDDDVDIAMPRSDYETFLKLYNGKNNLQHYSRNPNYYFPYIKLFSADYPIMKIEDETIDIFEEVYCDIDIYPIDGLGNNQKSAVRWFKIVSALKKMVYLNTSSNLSTNLFKRTAVRLLRKIPSGWMVCMLDKLMKIHSYKRSKFVTRWRLPSIKEFVYAKDDFGVGINRTFEGSELIIPSKYDKILTSVYGDYMKPERENHGARHSVKANVELKKWGGGSELIGILTYFDALNFGATLQAYALCQYLRNQGYEAEVINYVNAKMEKETRPYYCKSRSAISKLIAVYCSFARMRSKKSYKRFFSKTNMLSAQRIHTTEELKKTSEKYDSIIVGSDQIFNYNGTGCDFNFYLEFADDQIKKIAYAPSFGVNSIDQNYETKIRNLLLDFHALSSREITGKKIINELTGIDTAVVCDPTLLVEKKEWDKIAAPVKFSNYILVYAFGSSDYDSVSERIARERNLTIIDINRIIPKKGHTNISGIGPEEFVGLIANASFVITNSYHGFIFSMIYHKNVLAIKNKYANADSTNSRFDTLKIKLGLHEYEFDENEHEIDYDSFEKKMDEWRNISEKFLADALYDE